MLTDQLRTQIERLARDSMPNNPVPRPHFPSDARELPSLVPGEEVETPVGVHWRSCRPLAEFWPAAGHVLAETARAVPSAIAGTAPQPIVHPELAALGRAFPRQAVFLDLETCGFSGSMLFLVGLIYHDREHLVLDQLLARDPREEAAVLSSLTAIIADRSVLATFNGKSFDWPMVRERTARHRLKPTGTFPAAHCDLLHQARRRWRGTLPDCRLQTLERFICGRQRQGDLPGSEIPGAYHDFVRTGDARTLRAICQHNALDLVTLVEVATRLMGAPGAVARNR